MNATERLLTVLKGSKADRVPCICPGGMMNMIITELMEATGITWPKAHLDPVAMADLAEAAVAGGMFENYGVPFCMTVEAESLGARVDLGDLRLEPRVVDYALTSVSDYGTLQPASMAEGRTRVTAEAIRILKQRDKEVPVVGNLVGPVSVATSIMEPTVYYKELRKKPQEAHALMERITAQSLAFARAQIEAGADVITIADPSGTGELLGPKYFREYAVRYNNRLIAGIRAMAPGLPVILHICGQMRSVLEELKELTADGYSFDAVVSVREMRRAMPGKVLMGNISTFALEGSDPGRIRHMTRSVMKAGIDIVAPACGLGTSSPLANIRAILETVTSDDGS